MDFWSEIVGQPEAVTTLKRALDPGRGDLTHAWLLTGPPGSGRFNLALRFAAALVAQRTPADAATQYQQVVNGTHPDVKLVRTQTNELGVAQMREAVASAYFAPATSPYRVIVIEDADRMNAQAANATLKALEEPPPTTVWILCAPSEADLLPTIRSRTRLLRLRTPSVAQAAELLTQRDGISPELAAQAGRLAQGHIGMARRLATDPEALKRRTRSVTRVLDIVTLSDAMAVAAELAQLAEADAAQLVSQSLDQARELLFKSLGLDATQPIPRDQAKPFKDLEDDAKRRLTRAKIDGTDRVLLDLLTLVRDIISVQLGTGSALINEELGDRITRAAESVSLGKMTQFAKRLEAARLRLGRNIAPQLVLEAALVGLITIPNDFTPAPHLTTT